MRILKKAEQKNFIVRRDFYTEDKLFEMYKSGFIVSFDDYYKERVFNNIDDIRSDDIFRVFADNIHEIKVIYLTEYGFYTNVAVMNNGENIFISLD